MIIDDSKAERESIYKHIISTQEFDPLFVWTKSDFEKHQAAETPVDGYIIDVFLDQGDWGDMNAAQLIKETIQDAPRPAPIFLVSRFWGDTKILNVLKLTGESKAQIVQYLSWSEFEDASKKTKNSKIKLDALQNKIIFELNRWHGRSGFKPDPNETIKILLLADLQYGDPATDPEANFVEHLIVNALKRDTLVPHLILNAGDISFSGSPKEYELAKERLTDDLMKLLWGNSNIRRFRDRLVIVPGNHDVNLRFSACDKYNYNLKDKKLSISETPIEKRNAGSEYDHHKYSFEPFRRFAEKLTGDRNFLSSSNLSWVDRRFLHCGIRFFILNTAVEIDSENPSSACLSDSAMRQIGRSLGKNDRNEIFTIAVSHHGLRPEGKPSEDYNEIEDWMTVGRDNFNMHGVQMWIFGHYHEYYCQSFNGEPFNQNPLWMIQVPTGRIGHSTRGFCVLELHRNNGKVNDALLHRYSIENGIAEKKDPVRVFGKG